MIMNLLNNGYTDNDLLTALDRIGKASQESRIRDHTAYYLTILDQMYESNELEGNVSLR